MKVTILIPLCLLFLFMMTGEGYAQCTGCTHTITSSNQTVPSGLTSSSVLCFSGNFTYTTNFDINGSQICIGPGVTVQRNGGNWNGAWTINNYGSVKFSSLNLNSDNTINNYGLLDVFGGMQINGVLNLAGTVKVGGDLHMNGTGRISVLNANQCNSVFVTGNFTTNGVITGNNLDYGGTGSALLVNKVPGGNAIPKLTGGAKEGNCSTIKCVETVTMKDTGKIDMVYIFRCSDNFVLPTPPDDLELSDAAVLIVAGGGGGGMGDAAGGGGAGSFYEANEVSLQPSTVYPVIVGSGGVGASHIEMRGKSGFTSSFNGIATKGGGGGGSSSINNGLMRNGGAGGSGGGGASNENFAGNGGDKDGLNTFSGGKGDINSARVRAGGGGGGGGAMGAGVNASPPAPGMGGVGKHSFVLENILTNLPNRFSAGGGGTGRNPGDNSNSQSNGGSVNNIVIGGIGNVSGLGGNGASNTGSGGGAGSTGGGSGAAGVVVLRLSFGALPVEFVSVNAFYDHLPKSVAIQWVTSIEWENNHFEIERSVNNINNWVKVGEVAGMGWTDKTTQYIFKDSQLPISGGKIYYRLRQVDFSLKHAYSKTVMVNVPAMGTSSLWKAFPNPVQDGDHIVLSRPLGSEIAGVVEVSLISSQTRISQFSAANVADLNEKLSKAVVYLPKGLFIIELKWEDKIEYLKVLKK